MIKRKVAKSEAYGFSLLEIMVVLGLVALAYAAFIPLLQRGFDHYKLANTTRDVVSAIRQARNIAIGKNKETTITFDVENKTYRISGLDEVKMDDDIDMEVFATTSEVDQDHFASIRFYPDGSASGGRVTLVYEEEYREIDVLWMTGVVKVLYELRDL